VCPDDGRAWMAFENGDELREVGWAGGVLSDVLREWEIDVVVQDDDEAGFGGEIEDAVESGIFEAGYFARNFCGNEFLVNGELADAGEDARKSFEDTANVVGGVHVGGIETGDHGVDARLLIFGQRFVGHGDGGVGERVVVERRIAVEVVSGRAIAVDAIGPFLLKGNTEEGDSASVIAHHVQKIVDAGAFLNVVGEMAVRIVELVSGSLRVKWGGATDDVERGEGSEAEHSACENAKRASQFGVLQRFWR